MNADNHDERGQRARRHSPRTQRAMATRPLLFALLVGCLLAAGITLHAAWPSENAIVTRHSDGLSTTAVRQAGPSIAPPLIAPQPTKSSNPLPPDVSGSFEALAGGISGTIGLAVAPVGGGNVLNLGEWTTGAAWSTSKVPVALAALHQDGSVSASVDAAITQSDNAAAEEVWASLGDPSTAKAKVEAVMRGAGDDTSIQSERIRPEYTAFGQTEWSLASQASFMANVECESDAAPILQLMGRIEPSQSWGLGRVPGAEFKGGWGPGRSGAYLVRQFGVVPTSNGFAAVAIATEPSSGSFDDGIQALNTMAGWISAHLDDLPSGRCPGQ